MRVSRPKITKLLSDVVTLEETVKRLTRELEVERSARKKVEEDLQKRRADVITEYIKSVAVMNNALTQVIVEGGGRV